MKWKNKERKKTIQTLYYWHQSEEEQEGRMEEKSQTEKHSSWEGERVGENLSGWSRKHGWETGQDSFGKQNFNVICGKRQQAYFIIHHPKGTRFHFHCLILMVFLGYSLSLLLLSWIYLLISLHFVLFLDHWQWCEHTIIKSDSQKVKNLLAHL